MTLLVLIGEANNAKTVQLVIIIILIGKEMLSLMATSDGVARPRFEWYELLHNRVNEVRCNWEIRNNFVDIWHGLVVVGALILLILQMSVDS